MINVNSVFRLVASFIASTEKATVVELWINDLLPSDQKDTIRYTSGFRIDTDGLAKFDQQIDDYLNRRGVLCTSPA